VSRFRPQLNATNFGIGTLVRFVLLPGQRYDTNGVAPAIKGAEFGGLVADKAFDANWIIAELNERGADIVISQRPKPKAPLGIDLDVYKWRHLIENFVCKLKELKRVAMRSDKTDTSFTAMIHLSSTIINSRSLSTCSSIIGFIVAQVNHKAHQSSPSKSALPAGAACGLQTA